MIQVKKKRWEDITINDYKEIVNITQKELDSDLEKSISILAILCECTEDDLYSSCNILTIRMLLQYKCCNHGCYK